MSRSATVNTPQTRRTRKSCGLAQFASIHVLLYDVWFVAAMIRFGATVIRLVQIVCLLDMLACTLCHSCLHDKLQTFRQLLISGLCSFVLSNSPFTVLHLNHTATCFFLLPPPLVSYPQNRSVLHCYSSLAFCCISGFL